MLSKRNLIGWIVGLMVFSLSCSTPARNFTIIVLPDTQFYSAGMHGGTPEIELPGGEMK